MHYNVSQLLKEPTGSTRRYILDEEVPDLDPSLVLPRNISGEVRMLRTGEGILVTADLSTAVEQECVRCLDPVVSEVKFQIEEEFKPTIDIATGIPLPLPDVEQATLIDAQHTLDLSEVVRQNLILSLPPFPVCRPNCRGLCPVCGLNLNEYPEHRHQEEADPRLAVLKEKALSSISRDKD